MNTADKLLEQRDAVLFGKWQKAPPENFPEACAVQHVAAGERIVCLTGQPLRLVAQVIRDFHPNALPASNDLFFVGAWNDEKAKNVGEVLEVLDEAIRRAKASDGSEGVDDV